MGRLMDRVKEFSPYPNRPRYFKRKLRIKCYLRSENRIQTMVLTSQVSAMESFSTLPLSQLSFRPPKPKRNTASSPSPSPSPWNQRTTKPSRIRCQKMFVPGFGEASPEAKAAKNLHNFFTYVAIKIVSAQLESYNPEAYEELMEFLSKNSLNDGDKFCANLMRESPRHQSLALRILEVRSAYCKKDFEWDNLKRLAFKMVDESNTRVMRDYVLETSHEEN